MAPRVARANLPSAKPKNAKQKNKKRSLDAYAQAQKIVKEKGPVRSHRLGEVEDDEPRQKRRRDESDDEDEEEEERPQRKRRAAQDEDDGVEHGSDSEGHEWTMGGLGEDADDSDLDSDEAFGESDEEKFAGWTFRASSSGKSKGKGKKTKASSSRDMDLDEGESDGDSDDSQDDEGLGLGDEAVDLAAMLDDDDEEVLGGKDNTAKDMGEESGSEEEDEDEEGYSSESEDNEEEDDDEDMELRAASMRDRIEALDPGSRKPVERQPVADVTEDDFLEGTSLATEKKSKKKKSDKPTTLAAPLPKRQQDRLDREVASQKAKEQLDRWRDTVVKNRRAEFLSFPLQDPADQSGTIGKEKFTPANQQAPRNGLEESIHRIMEESGLASKPSEENPNDVGDEEAALLKAEELAEKQLPVEEVMRRRAELRRSRELLFREEIKAKRIAKIKSKSYRRVHRKERERQAEREQELMEGLGADGMDEDEKEKQDRKRAQARMSTKHKDSKWAKSLKQTNRTAWDDEARDGAVEQARRNEELKKRIAGGDLSDEGSDIPSDDDGDSEDDEFTIKQLEGLNGKGTGASSRLANLKFMRESDERRRKANDEDVERLRKELAVADGDEEESGAEDEGLGRAIFGPGSKEQKKPDPKMDKLEFEAPEGSDGEEVDEAEEEQATIVTEKPQSKAQEAAKPKGILKKTEKASGPLANGSNGWLKDAEAKTETSQSSSTGWLNAKKAKARRSNVEEDIVTDVLAPKQQPAKAPEADIMPTSNDTAADTNGWTVVKYAKDSDSSAEDEPSDPILSKQDHKLSLQQRAFAGDDVQAAFETEKASMVASEDEKEISNHLPGWGSWTGTGLSKSIRKANARAKHNPLYKTKIDGVKQADRKDSTLKNVIISEKQDRKGKKYLTEVLPFEFENREQYERSRRVPLGPEWTTKEVHQRMTRPRVVVKKGVNVRALERPLA